MQISANHRVNLPHDPPNKKPHNHIWKITIEIHSTDLNQNGMIVDFKYIKEITDQLDQMDINSIMEKPPTIECTSKWIGDRITTLLKDKNRCSDTAKLKRVQIQETEENIVCYIP